MVVVLGIVENEVHLLAWIHLLECGEEALLYPSNELLTVDGVVIVGGSDVVNADLVEDESAAVVEFRQDVRWLVIACMMIMRLPLLSPRTLFFCFDSRLYQNFVEQWWAWM